MAHMIAKKLALPVAVMLRVALCYGSTQRIGNNKIFFSPILLHRALVVIQSLNRLCQCQLYLFRALYILPQSSLSCCHIKHHPSLRKEKYQPLFVSMSYLNTSK